jgi:NADPH:quinone reductase
MNTGNQKHGLELRSRMSSQGELELSLEQVEIPNPAPDEVVIRVEASPINPSDLGLLLGPADMSKAKAGGTAERPVVTASVAPLLLKALSSRLDKSMPVGNEGAGVVIQTGANAQELRGKTVAAFGGGMYTQFRVVKASQCLVLPEGATPADGASCFVNPLTALGMVETLRREGHKALVHTAAASNLGQMLNKICLKDGIGLVNIVRSQEQVALLRGQGAAHVCDSTSSTFTEELTQALAETGATLAFDATGGGRLAGQILTCMEAVASRTLKGYTPYGSFIHKQVYVYGRLDPRPLEVVGNFGTAWSVGGWLLPPFLEKIGPEAAQRLRERVAAELKTTFASHYAAELSLAEVLQLDKLSLYSKRATGKKYLINPNKGLR